MGFLKSLGSLTKAVVDVAVTPVEIVKDVATMGGLSTDRDSYTIERVKKLGQNLENAYDELDEG